MSCISITKTKVDKMELNSITDIVITFAVIMAVGMAYQLLMNNLNFTFITIDLQIVNSFGLERPIKQAHGCSIAH